MMEFICLTNFTFCGYYLRWIDVGFDLILVKDYWIHAWFMLDPFISVHVFNDVHENNNLRWWCLKYDNDILYCPLIRDLLHHSDKIMTVEVIKIILWTVIVQFLTPFLNFCQVLRPSLALKVNYSNKTEYLPLQFWHCTLHLYLFVLFQNAFEILQNPK